LIGSHSLFESTLLNFLGAAPSVTEVELLRSGLDFAVRTASGERVLIEAKGSNVSQQSLNRLGAYLSTARERGDRFLLVTPEPPTDAQRRRFEGQFDGIGIACQWIGIQELPAALGAPSPGDFREPKVLADLQLASLVKSIERYGDAPVGHSPDEPTVGSSAPLLSLSRQFSHSVIQSVTAHPHSLEETLRIAQRVPEVTVVLTDIVNFATLVAASRPEDLREAMSRYYRLARNAVFENGGMLDKFIGDAVLAVFGYPIPGQSDTVSAVRFAKQLIDIGREVLPEWLDELNHSIDTGTRVGIATGDIWPINIGTSEVEIALLGDTINLAARLEKNCQPNELLIDNRTKRKAGREDASFVDALALKAVVIEPGAAKGQNHPLRAWATGADG
jgi:adenylate cyclase